MDPGGRLLCAIDRDARAAALVACARQWGDATGLRPLFVHASANGASSAAGARTAAGDAFAELGIAEDELHVVPGDAAAAILETIRTEQPSALLLSSGSREGDLGGMCTTLLRAAPRPVVVLPPGGEETFTGGPIACAVSLGRDDEAAVRFASALASETDRRLMLANVVGAADAARLAAARARGTLTDDDARERAAAPLAERLVGLARDADADALVLAAGDANGASDGVLGAVARALWTTSPCPVVLVDA
jgi:nucleotide-binding universal stress UspA family protein